jgi:hypothetical protein
VNDSLTVGRLTLMLLRASVSHPESLPADYGVIILPSTDVLSQDEAILSLSRMRGELEVEAKSRGRDLVVAVHPPSQEDIERLEVAARTFYTGIRSLNPDNRPDTLVKAVGFRESMLAPTRVVEQWLKLVDCADCPMGLGRPSRRDPASVIAVLYLGRSE